MFRSKGRRNQGRSTAEEEDGKKKSMRVRRRKARSEDEEEVEEEHGDKKIRWGDRGRKVHLLGCSSANPCRPSKGPLIDFKILDMDLQSRNMERRVPMPTVPWDIIFHILLCLPIKSLCRFKCIAKSWAHLISRPDFIRSHRKQSEHIPRFFIISSITAVKHGYRNLQFETVDENGQRLSGGTIGFKQNCGGIRVVSCLDLVCIYSEESMYIWNPATREQIALPKGSLRCNNKFIVLFGYVATTSEYKLLQVIDNSRCTVCEVFTLGSEYWRVVECPPFAIKMYGMNVVNGSAYFLPLRFALESNDGLARFDMEKEKWSVGMLPGPSFFSYNGKSACASICLRQFAGRLWIESIHKRYQLDLWVLEDFNGGIWVKKYSNLKSHGLPVITATSEKDVRVVFSCLYKLQVYDNKVGCLREEFYSPSWLFGKVNSYVESCMSLEKECFRSMMSW